LGRDNKNYQAFYSVILVVYFTYKMRDLPHSPYYILTKFLQGRALQVFPFHRQNTNTRKVILSFQEIFKYVFFIGHEQSALL